MNLKQFIPSVCALLLSVASIPALANDQITSTVTNAATGPQAIIVNNGQPSGTIQLWYTVTAATFPCGAFSTFNLALHNAAGTNGKAPTYPVTLNLAQSGNGTPVQFSPVTPSFSVTGATWSGSTQVPVSIDCTKLPSGAPYDGEEIVGNLNEQTSPSGAHLDTISTIQVHIKLSIPNGACLKLYSFQTDQDTGDQLSAISVTANKNLSVKSTSPGTLSVDGLVVNTCSTSQSFDLAVGLDPQWETIPNNNAGNAVFSYSASTGDIDLSTYSLAAFGVGTPQGEGVCLANMTLAPGDSFLETVHSKLKDGFNTADLPTDKAFAFSAQVSAANTGCSANSLLSASPSNPANSPLPFTIQ